jgi:hypothetical protein
MVRIHQAVLLLGPSDEVRSLGNRWERKGHRDGVASRSANAGSPVAALGYECYDELGNDQGVTHDEKRVRRRAGTRKRFAQDVADDPRRRQVMGDS